ncbi:hypothetical protein F5Y19DRAFT_26106 [Xylariaceae sp. FL1651]|nr:hypothetical protein F5Y19DRAFT_26106 [Xylariaceae sp. FL1651]
MIIHDLTVWGSAPPLKADWMGLYKHKPTDDCPCICRPLHSSTIRVPHIWSPTSIFLVQGHDFKMPRSAAASARNRPRPNNQSDLLTVSLAGSIRWLPPKDKVGDLGLKKGCYNHPVVVLSYKVQDGRVDILIITSFRGRDLVKKFPQPSDLRESYLPIKPSSAHPDHGVLLVLADNRQELSKKSYVGTRKVFKVPLTALHRYDEISTRDYCLSNESFGMLLARCADVPPTGLSPSSEERTTVRTRSQNVAISDQPHSRPQVSDARIAQLLVQATVSINLNRAQSRSNGRPPISYSPSTHNYLDIPSTRYNPPRAYPPRTPSNYYKSTTGPYPYDTTHEPNKLQRCLRILATVLFASAIIHGLGYELPGAMLLSKLLNKKRRTASRLWPLYGIKNSLKWFWQPVLSITQLFDGLIPATKILRGDVY